MQPRSPQSLPHDPQLFRSLLVSTHWPSQSASPALHLTPHWLFEHVALAPAGAAQARPHCPQFARSVCVSTQLPAQGTSPAAHWNEQFPALQRGDAFAGAEQTLAHLPQLEVSESRSTHEPEHAVFEPQSVLHLPDLQTWPLSHAVVQLPQWSRFDVRSTQAPLHTL